MPRPVLLLKTGTTFCILIEAIKTIDAQLRTLSGNPPSPVSLNLSSPSTIRFCTEGTDFDKQPLNLLDREIGRLRALIGIDAQNAKAFARLTEKISRDEVALAKLKRDIETVTKADERITELIDSKRDSYAAVFDGIVERRGAFAPVRTVEKSAIAIRRPASSASFRFPSGAPPMSPPGRTKVKIFSICGRLARSRGAAPCSQRLRPKCFGLEKRIMQ